MTVATLISLVEKDCLQCQLSISALDANGKAEDAANNTALALHARKCGWQHMHS